MKISFEGREWEYDEDHITVQQAMAMHLAHGLTLKDFVDGIPKLDPRSMQCAYWLMLAQNGVAKPIKDCEFPLVGFIAAYSDAQHADLAASAGTAAEAETVAAVPTIPSPTGAGSPGPAIPTAMTPVLPAQVPVPVTTAYGSPPS